MRLDERFPTTSINEWLADSLIDRTESFVYEDVMHPFVVALTSLSNSEQTLLRLKYEQELSLKELAHRSGLSLSAVKMRLKRSRDKIQRCYYANQIANQIPG